MGQAKLRGNREKRVAESIEAAAIREEFRKRQEEQAIIEQTPEQKQSKRNAQILLAALSGIAASRGLYSL